jgi:hypothetical protein
MAIAPRDLRTIGLAALAVAAAVLIGFEGWLDANRPVEFCGLVMTATLAAAATRRQPAAERRGAMSPSFVIELSTLLLVGPLGALLVALVGGAMKGRIADQHRAVDRRRIIINTATAVVATAAAAFIYRLLGAAVDRFGWPLQALPIAAAAGAYLTVTVAVASVVVPLIAKQPVDRTWPARLAREAPAYLIGAGVAVLLAELIDRRLWDVLPVAAVPLGFVFSAYARYLEVSRMNSFGSRLPTARTRGCA